MYRDGAMNDDIARAGIVIVMAGALAGCGSSGTTAADAGRDANPPATSCVQPGEPGNETGVGRYCSPHGGECATTASARLCLPDLAPTVGDWYCLKLCTTDAECGSSAVCVHSPSGSGCAPLQCVRTSDAGLDDAGPDDAGIADAGADGG